MYEKEAPEGLLLAFGLTKDDMPDEIIEVYPDNWNSFLIFDGMSTQWRAGFNGPIGLDYSAIPIVGKSIGLSSRKSSKLLHDIRVMEAEALKLMAEEREMNKK